MLTLESRLTLIAIFCRVWGRQQLSVLTGCLNLGWLAEDVGKMSAISDESDTRLEGFEPTTPGSEDRCSSPLSYRRTLTMLNYTP